MLVAWPVVRGRAWLGLWIWGLGLSAKDHVALALSAHTWQDEQIRPASVLSGLRDFGGGSQKSTRLRASGVGLRVYSSGFRGPASRI